MAGPRRMLGVVRQASWSSFGTWTTLHTGTIADARGATAQTLPAEFLGDYNSAWATNSGVFGGLERCPRHNPLPGGEAWRQSFLDGSPTAQPAPQNDCPDMFGASSIYGGWSTP
jgi:hypothetical protein